MWDFAAHERYLKLGVNDSRREEFHERHAFEAVPFSFAGICVALTKYESTQDGQQAFWSEELTRGGDEGPRGIRPYCKWVAEKHSK